MRRWNGWGDENIEYPLPVSALEVLNELLGTSAPIPDASFPQTIAQILPSRIRPHPLMTTDPTERLRHARGQSLPDWIALRYGRIQTFPDAVAFPGTAQEIGFLIEFAQKTGCTIIPYGGGTSVVGHINTLPSEKPSIVIDLSLLNRLEQIDPTSLLAAFGAGIRGPQLEAELNKSGFTLGHFPQSFEYSTLGGWIATRSSGQQSCYYGRIEDLFAGGHIETLSGPWDLPPLPASAAGPDLKQIVLGSEGRIGIITQAIVRIQRLPDRESFYGFFLPTWEHGIEGVRSIAQHRIPISMARLSNPRETEITLMLSGKDKLVHWADRGLRLIRYGSERSLLIIGVTGDQNACGDTYHQAYSIIRKNQGLPTGQIIGKTWRKSRFFTPYLRNSLWDRNFAIDTLETALPWSAIHPAADDIQQAIRRSSDEFGGRVLVFAHLSHIYSDGASIYVTFIFPRRSDPDQTLAHWQSMKTAASQVILSYHGTISHQHGVGLDHLHYLADEKGLPGMKILASTFHAMDPDGIFNPGKLVK